MVVEIVVFLDGAEFSRVGLKEGSFLLVGSGPDADLMLRGVGIVDEHCVFDYTSERVLLTNKKVNAHTVVNGQPILTSYVTSADDICIGAYQLKLELHGRLPSDKYAVLNNLQDSVTTVATSQGGHDTAERFFINVSTILKEASSKVEPDSIAYLKAIHNSMETLSREIPIEEALTVVSMEILGCIPARRVVLVLWREAIGSIVPVAVVSRGDKDSINALPVSQTVMDEVLRTGSSLLSTNVQLDERTNRSSSVEMQNLRSILCVPLKARDRCWGAIYADSTEIRQAFTERHMEFVAALGYHVAVAVDRSETIRNCKALLGRYS